MGGAGSGRPRKSYEQHVIDGTFRPDHHGHFFRGGSGLPIKPEYLETPIGTRAEIASEHWDAVYPLLVDMGITKEIDTSALGALCDWWGEYVWFRDDLGPDTLAPKVRGGLMSMAFNTWKGMSTKFGLNPIDRANLTNEKSTAELDSLEAFNSKAG